MNSQQKKTPKTPTKVVHNKGNTSAKIQNESNSKKIENDNYESSPEESID